MDVLHVLLCSLYFFFRFVYVFVLVWLENGLAQIGERATRVRVNSSHRQGILFEGQR